MNTRKLSSHESDNLARIHEAGLPVALLFVTATGLAKGILDATEPMRQLFLNQGIHDYAGQRQGEESKVIVPTVLFENATAQTRRLSLYRPRTKLGDPRMWLQDFKHSAVAGEVFAVFVLNGKLHFLSLSRTLLGHELDLGSPRSAEALLLEPLIRAADATSSDLLALLRAIAAKGPLKAVGHGSTAVGRTIEAALGIPMNSSKRPDYRGIEIKSGRSKLAGSESRAHLFAQVPDWTLSKFGSVRSLLENCGYERDGKLRLCCTVSSLRENPQGLLLRVKDDLVPRLLEEYSRRHRSAVVVWQLDGLESRLREKHRETFWIKVRSIRRTTGEWFELLSATHTRNPVDGQFSRLLDSGSVTLDHEISGDLASKRAHEHGPAFKLERARMGELFRGIPREYELGG